MVIFALMKTRLEQCDEKKFTLDARVESEVAGIGHSYRFTFPGGANQIF